MQHVINLCSQSRLLTWHNSEIAYWPSDPISYKRVRSKAGDEERAYLTGFGNLPLIKLGDFHFLAFLAFSWRSIEWYCFVVLSSYQRLRANIHHSPTKTMVLVQGHELLSEVVAHVYNGSCQFIRQAAQANSVRSREQVVTFEGSSSLMTFEGKMYSY